MKIAYFDCFSGISGDMILGALVDAGVDGEALQSELLKLKLQDYSLNFTKSIKHGITGTKANVRILEEAESHHHEHADDEHNGEHAGAIHEVIVERSEHTHDELSHSHITSRFLSDIFTLIDESNLNQRIKNTTKAIFDRLAAAEAKVHGVTKDTVHLHEVSAVDSIVDIVGAVIGIDLLDIEEVYASPISLGSGFVRCSHGVMPVPVPGTLELLVGVPVRQTNIRKELVTPTGAAIITTLAKGFGAMPQMTIDKIGYGAGSRDLEEQPNLLRVIIGEKKEDSSLSPFQRGAGGLFKEAGGCYDEDKIIVLETNIDDMSSEIYGYLMEKLFPLGALDVFFTPIFMKKNRPATMLNVLVEQQNLENIVNFILAETTTFGVRFYEVERQKLQREFMTVKTQYGDIRVKMGKVGDKVIKAVPEYEDCKKLAEANGVPVRKVYESAVSNFTTNY
ncbi:nickel pincer cofactor biosynthesis protein LarC [Candidatus Poribacteria bacterium]|nr:nickel pincer cofactor biosynthesis protein LarC [Candidatus Poribacteria bacterium]